jgi:D-3-phosphoglycerate dehydrogenase
MATPHLGASTNEAQENVALQVAEQMSDYLLTGAVTNALNSPSVTAEEAPRLKPFVALAEKLGALAGQMVDFGIKAIDIAYEGEVAKLNVKPLTAAALAGNAAADAGRDQHGLRPGRGQGARHHRLGEPPGRRPVYDSLMRVTITTEKGKRAFAGTVIAGAPRIVEVKGMELDAAFSPAMLYVNNLDKPGFIGALGHAAGRRPASTSPPSTSAACRPGEDAIALVGVDQAPTESPAGQDPGRLPHVKEARALTF